MFIDSCQVVAQSGLRALTLCLCLGVGLSHAELVFYRYKDSSGRMVMTNILPPEVVKDGYQIVNSRGRVLRDVPPALTPEQIAERDRKAEEERQRAEAARLQAEQDALLLRQYPRLDDVVRARERRLAEIETMLTFKRSAIGSSQVKIDEALQKAANLERAGITVPDSIPESIRKEEANVMQLESDIEQLENDLEAARKEFDEKIERVRYLTRQSDSESP